MIEAIAALLGPIARLIEAMSADDYDQEAEKQAMLDIERAVSDERVRRALKK